MEAANKAIGSSEVIAARRLPSGDTILTFEGKAVEFTKDTIWVQAAFGTSAKVKAREFMVIVKGLSAQRLRAIHDPEQVVNELKKRTAGINRCKVQLLRMPESRYTMVILYMNSVVAAQEVYRRGVVFEAQYFSTEPFYTATQIHRCFRYHKFGHIARYYNNRTRYSYCTGVAHKGREANCPEKGEGGQKRCMNCSYGHPV